MIKNIFLLSLFVCAAGSMQAMSAEVTDSVCLAALLSEARDRGQEFSLTDDNSLAGVSGGAQTRYLFGSGWVLLPACPRDCGCGHSVSPDFAEFFRLRIEQNQGYHGLKARKEGE